MSSKPKEKEASFQFSLFCIDPKDICLLVISFSTIGIDGEIWVASLLTEAFKLICPLYIQHTKESQIILSSQQGGFV